MATKKKRTYVDFKALKARVSMEDLLARYELIRHMEAKDEETLIGPCPITGSSSATAFKVNTAKDIWYSFACEDGGNILDFVAQMEDTDIVGAANLIAEWFDREEERGEAPDEPSPTGDEEAETSDRPEKSFYEGIDELCSDELALIHDAASREIREAIAAGDTGEINAEEKIDELTDWILRAYQAGYEHGKMIGSIESRVNNLRNR